MKVVEIIENPEANEPFVDLGEKKSISCEDVAFIALEIGEHIQRSGGEIGRVEDTIKRICKAYGAIHVDVFALTSIIILSVNFGDRTFTRTRRITKGGVNNFSKLAKLNQLSREVCSTCPPKEGVIEKMQEITNKTQHVLPLFLLAHVLTALGFCMYFGGSMIESLVAGFIALLMYVLHRIISGPHMNVIMAKLIICFFGGLSTVLVTFIGNSYCGLTLHSDLIMIGTIMNVIPGVAFTNSLRDLLGGDLMTGILRLSEVLIDTVAIAGGYAMSLLLLKNIANTTTTVQEATPEMILYRFIGAMICTFGLTLLYNLEWRSITFAMIGAAIACLIFEIYIYMFANVFVGALLAAMAVAAYSDIIAHIIKTPTTILLIPGIVPMVPGGLLFRAMLALLDKEAESASDYGSRALFVSMGITIGILAATFVFRTLWSSIEKFKQNKEHKFSNIIDKIKKV